MLTGLIQLRATYGTQGETQGEGQPHQIAGLWHLLRRKKDTGGGGCQGSCPNVFHTLQIQFPREEPLSAFLPYSCEYTHVLCVCVCCKLEIYHIYCFRYSIFH